MRGPKPKPTRLKVMAGNPGKRALPQGEPIPEGTADRPKWLSKESIKVWEDLAPRCERLGLLTEQDGEAFGILCTLAAEFRKNSGEMSANRISRLDALMQRFGMDPGSRTRISVQPPTGGEDKRRKFGLA